MKKLILLLSIITICYSCQKQTIAPIVAKSTQTIYDPCADSGICSEGFYETGPTFLANYDTIIHQKNSITQFGKAKLTFIGYGSPKSVLDDTLLYKVTLYNTDSTYINMSTIQIIHVQNHRTADLFTCKSKSGKWIIFRFKSH